MSSSTHQGLRPLLGLRARPGRLALAAMRLPRPLYHRGFGGLLGHTFLLITHRGRTTGLPRETVAMALSWNPNAREAIVCSVWGETQWIRNLRARPALRIEIGGDSFSPRQRFLSDAEAVTTVRTFAAEHPWRLRLFTAVFGWGNLDSDDAIATFVAGRPFVAFRGQSRTIRDEMSETMDVTIHCSSG